MEWIRERRHVHGYDASCLGAAGAHVQREL
jgi:hypothetical protein